MKDGCFESFCVKKVAGKLQFVLRLKIRLLKGKSVILPDSSDEKGCQRIPVSRRRNLASAILEKDDWLYSYIKPSVKIEPGARSDHWPPETHAIRSCVGESLNLPLGEATVQALTAERTFWQKATLLHAECVIESPVDWHLEEIDVSNNVEVSCIR